MKNNILNFILLISLLLTTACQIWEKDNMDFTYPLETGRTWTYQRDLIQTNFENDSLTQIFEDTLTYDVTTEVIGPVTLRDSIETIKIRIKDSVEYYKEDSTGLYIVAYERGMGETIMPKMSSNSHIDFKGMHFNNFEELSEMIQQITPLTKSLGDSITFESVPLKVLSYPLEEATEWCFRNPIDFRIDKHMIAEKMISVEAGTFACYHIKWYYDFNNDEVWDDDLWIDDYISKEGLVKRFITALNCIVGDDFGNPLGTCDLYDIYELKSYSK